jgi:hypothetical protein
MPTRLLFFPPMYVLFTLQVRASDEMYFPCCLAVLGLIPPPESAVTDTEQSGSSGSTVTKVSTLASSSAPPVSSESGAAKHSNGSRPEEEEAGLQEKEEEEEKTSDDKEVSKLRSKCRDSAGASSAPRNAVLKRQLTYCVWGQSAKSPQTFEGITEEDIDKARRNGSVFFRKVVLPVAQSSSASSSSSKGLLSHEKLHFLRVWLDLVLGIRDDVEESNSLGTAPVSTNHSVNNTTAAGSGAVGTEDEKAPSVDTGAEVTTGEGGHGGTAVVTTASSSAEDDEMFNVAYCLRRVEEYQQEREQEREREREREREMSQALEGYNDDGDDYYHDNYGFGCDNSGSRSERYNMPDATFHMRSESMMGSGRRDQYDRRDRSYYHHDHKRDRQRDRDRDYGHYNTERYRGSGRGGGRGRGGGEGSGGGSSGGSGGYCRNRDREGSSRDNYGHGHVHDQGYREGYGGRSNRRSRDRWGR